MLHIFKVPKQKIIGDVLRKVAFLHLNEITKAKVVEILYKRPNGLVIILPSKIQDQNEWRLLQEFFCSFNTLL